MATVATGLAATNGSAVPPSPKENVSHQPQELELVAFATGTQGGMTLERASSERDWMLATPSKFAQRCLPLLIANQAGWHVVLQRGISVFWTGGIGTQDLIVTQHAGEGPGLASSHFGSGILTFTIPYLFRTPPGYNLLVRGPANWPKDGVAPLEGIVETDWATATFTMNWKLTRPTQTVRFDAGEPIALLVPQRRGELEAFVPSIQPLADEADLAARHRAWAESRGQFNDGLAAQKDGPGWQRHYFLGQEVGSGKTFPEHQTKLVLRPFGKTETKAFSSEVDTGSREENA